MSLYLGFGTSCVSIVKYLCFIKYFKSKSNSCQTRSILSYIYESILSYIYESISSYIYESISWLFISFGRSCVSIVKYLCFIKYFKSKRQLAPNLTIYESMSSYIYSLFHIYLYSNSLYIYRSYL